MNNQNSQSECCPKFEPSNWDEKVFTWKDKLFIKDKVFTLFYVPVNMGAVMARMQKKAEDAGAKNEDYLCLSECTSLWNSNEYLAVDKEIPGAENTKLSGKYISKVYEGDFSNTSKWIKDFEEYVKKKNHSLSKFYMWYTTCPECAKKYGKNYVVLIGQVE